MPKRRQTEPVRGELYLIERIRRRAARLETRIGSSAVRLGIGDDCAILRPPAGQELLVTTDFSLEGRHFRRDTHPPVAVGHRALARGLSDLAAMGARPMAAFLSLAVPRSLAADEQFLDGFLDGLLALAAAHRVPLAGGDTAEAPGEELLADIVLLGSAPRGLALRRSGTRPGDWLYVTGALGGAAAELQAVLAEPQRFSRAKAGEGAERVAAAKNSIPTGLKPASSGTLDVRVEASALPEARALQSRTFSATSAGDHPHLFPQPRLAVGRALLQRRLATACIDLSDGLSTDLNHLCVASGVAAEVDVAALPAHPLTVPLGDAAQIAAILHGGEDYELLFTAAPSTRMPRSIAGVPITAIGRIVAQQAGKPRMTLVADDTRFTLEARGWEHLR